MNKRSHFFPYRESDKSWRIETPDGPTILDGKTKLKQAQSIADYLRQKHTKPSTPNAIAKH